MPDKAILFAALGDETRLALVEQLRAGPASIVSLTVSGRREKAGLNPDGTPKVESGVSSDDDD